MLHVEINSEIIAGNISHDLIVRPNPTQNMINKDKT